MVKFVLLKHGLELPKNRRGRQSRKILGFVLTSNGSSMRRGSSKGSSPLRGHQSISCKAGPLSYKIGLQQLDARPR